MKPAWMFSTGNGFKLKYYEDYISHKRFLRKNLEMSWLKNNYHWTDFMPMPHERFRERKFKTSQKRIKEFEAW